MIEKPHAKALASTVWHKREQTLLLGCGNCPDRPICGGLQIRASIMSCQDFCCGTPNTCTIVCPKSPDFPRRVHEVQGFSLMHIEKRGPLSFPKSPNVLPLIYRSLPLLRPVPASIVAIPFSEAYWRRGKYAMPHARTALNAKFRLAPDTKLVLSGVENDRRVEKWWGSHGKEDVLGAIREMDILFATVPNFSSAADVPRHANMHGLKRIALVWTQLHDASIPAAVHANCRTDRDFARFGEFLKFHDEIEALAFEYTTGTANAECGEYFTSLLCELADQLARPMTLVLRGGVRWIAKLSRHYTSVVMLDTSACMRTINRKRAVFEPGRKLRWRKNPTKKGEPLDELLAHNLEVVAASSSDYGVDECATPQRIGVLPGNKRLKRQLETNDESLLGSFL